MKKTLLLVAGILLSLSMKAYPLAVRESNYDPALQSGQHKTPALLPTVDYEDGVLTAQSPYLLTDVMVVIRDSEGAALYTYYINSVSGTASINLPADILSDLYSVELLYGDHHLVGFF